MNFRDLGLGWSIILVASTLAGCQPEPVSVCLFDYKARDAFADPLWADVTRECNLVTTARQRKAQPPISGPGLAVATQQKEDPMYITPACEEALDAAFMLDDETFVAGLGFLGKENLFRAMQVLFFHPTMRTENDLILSAAVVDSEDVVEVPFFDIQHEQFKNFSDEVTELDPLYFNRQIRDYFCGRVENIDYLNSEGVYAAKIENNHLTVSESFGEAWNTEPGKYFVSYILYHEMIHGEENGGHVVCNDGIDDNLKAAAIERPEDLYCDKANGGTYTRQGGYMTALAVAGLFTTVDGDPIMSDEEARSLFYKSCRLAVERSNELREKYHGQVECSIAADNLMASLRLKKEL